MDAGRVVEHGTHDELMALGGMYFQLQELQSSRRNIRQIKENIRSISTLGAQAI